MSRAANALTAGPTPAPPPLVSPRTSRTVVRALSAAAALLVLLHVVFQYDRFHTRLLPWEIHALFDLDEEASAPTWFSSALWGSVAALFAMLAGAARAGRPDVARRWAWLAAIALLLSLDEVAGIHETVNDLSPINWTVPGAVVALGAIAVFAPFVARLAAPTRRGMIAALAIVLAGALGVEAITIQFFDESNKRQFTYALLTAVEEGFEMSGVILLVRTLMRHPTPREG